MKYARYFTIVVVLARNRKHFTINNYFAGYANTTSALTNIIFRIDSGNIANGKILMFGLN